MPTQSCTACTKNSPPLNKTEISQLLKKVPEYSLDKVEEIEQIYKSYGFKNFKEALAFTNALAELCEEQNHHPQIILEWGRVKVSWWTHAIGGLHANDFIMAEKTEELFQQA